MNMLKRVQSGIGIVEASIVLLMSAIVIDVIIMAQMKTKDLIYDREKAAFLVALKLEVQDYLQKHRRDPFSQTDGRPWQLTAKQLFAESEQPSTISAGRLANTHILLRIEQQSGGKSGLLSALIISKKNDNEKLIDLYRVNSLVGAMAGTLQKDNKTITNEKKSWSIQAADWQLGSIKPEPESNIIYIPSGLTRVIKKSTEKASVSNLVFELTARDQKFPCQRNIPCDWTPLYITDQIQLKWDKDSSANSVGIKITDDLGKIFYSAQFYARSLVNIPVSDDWLAKKLTVSVTPYNSHGTAGEISNYTVKITNPNSLGDLPFSLKFSAYTFNVKKDNHLNTSGTVEDGYAKLIFPGKFEVGSKSSSGASVANSSIQTIYVFIKPIVAELLVVDDDGNTLPLYYVSVKDTRLIDYLSEEVNLKKLINNKKIFPVPLYQSVSNDKKYQLMVKLYWNNSLVYETKSSKYSVNPPGDGVIDINL